MVAGWRVPLGQPVEFSICCSSPSSLFFRQQVGLPSILYEGRVPSGERVEYQKFPESVESLEVEEMTGTELLSATAVTTPHTTEEARVVYQRTTPQRSLVSATSLL